MPQLSACKVADIDSSPSKEEEDDDDDTMQNTVVLFSNTDKFVLMQVPYLTGVVPSSTLRPGRPNIGCAYFGGRVNEETQTKDLLLRISSFVCLSIKFLFSVSSELGAELGARGIVVKKARNGLCPIEAYGLGKLMYLFT